MYVHIHYEDGPNGTRTADITGDVAEFRAELSKLGVTEHAFLAKGHQPRGSMPYGEELRSLFAAMEEQFPMETMETRSSSPRAVRDRHPVIDRRAAMREHGEIIAAHNQRADEAFLTFLRYGLEFVPPELRAQSVGTDSAGGFLAAKQFADHVFTAMKRVDRLQDPDVVTVINTVPGSSFSILMLDDTSSSSSIVLENVGSALSPDLTFDSLVLPKADTWRTSMVKVSMELVQDSAFPIDNLLADAFAVRLRRGIGASFVTTLAAQATSGVSAGAAAIVPANLWDLFGSIDPEYIASQKCGWLMRQSTFIAISKLVDTAGLPVFPITRNPNGDFELLTRPVFFCPSVAAIGTTNRSIFFGALDYFVVRRVTGSLRIHRYSETYAEVGQVGFNAFTRTNAGLAKPATADSPIKFLQHA